ISGGTVAYFSDSVETENKVLSGILELNLSNVDNNGVLFEFKNKKPGDTFNHSFDLMNDGTLEMKDITLYSEHTILNRAGDPVNNDFEKQILVKKLQVGNENVLDEEITLATLNKKPIV